MLCIDLTTYLQSDALPQVGKVYHGDLMLDGEFDVCFVQDGNVEKRTEAVQRNPYVYRGLRINVHRKPDGTLYPTFNRPGYTQFFGFQHFCREAAQELLAVAGLVEEDVRK